MLLALVGLLASVQQVQTGFLDRSITVSGKSYHYQVYVPADYASKPTWPAILFLHGAGERGDDGLLQTNVGLAPAIRQNPARYPAIVVFPQVPRDSQWVGTPADMAVSWFTSASVSMPSIAASSAATASPFGRDRRRSSFTTVAAAATTTPLGSRTPVAMTISLPARQAGFSLVTAAPRPNAATR